MKPPTILLACALNVAACGGSERRAQDAPSQTTVTSATYETSPAPAARATTPDTTTANLAPSRDAAAASSPRLSAKLTAEIRRSIATDATLSVAARSVRVSADGGKVRLRGMVESDAERAKVEKHARFTTGVADVINDVEVRR